MFVYEKLHKEYRLECFQIKSFIRYQLALAFQNRVEPNEVFETLKTKLVYIGTVRPKTLDAVTIF